MLSHALDESQKTAPFLSEELIRWSVIAFVRSLGSKIIQGHNHTRKAFYYLSFANSLDHPVLLAERTAIVLFHPQRHAAVVKGMITFSPDHNTVLLFVFGLTSEAGIHHLDPANGAGIALNVPAPHGYRVPLLEGEHLVAPRLGARSPAV